MVTRTHTHTQRERQRERERERDRERERERRRGAGGRGMEPNDISKGTEGKGGRGSGCISDSTQTSVIKGCSPFATTISSGNGALMMKLR